MRRQHANLVVDSDELDNGLDEPTADSTSRPRTRIGFCRDSPDTFQGTITQPTGIVYAFYRRKNGVGTTVATTDFVIRIGWIFRR